MKHCAHFSKPLVEPFCWKWIVSFNLFAKSRYSFLKSIVEEWVVKFRMGSNFRDVTPYLLIRAISSLLRGISKAWISYPDHFLNVCIFLWFSAEAVLKSVLDENSPYSSMCCWINVQLFSNRAFLFHEPDFSKCCVVVNSNPK